MPKKQVQPQEIATLHITSHLSAYNYHQPNSYNVAVIATYYYKVKNYLFSNFA